MESNIIRHNQNKLIVNEPTKRVQKIEELVLNWHITQPCNFKCKYCYAKWAKTDQKRELWRDNTATENLLKCLYNYFNGATPNALQKSLSWSSQRLSLAGGEPTILRDSLTRIVFQAKQIGFNVSLITNGSSPDVITECANDLDIIGLSVDSVSTTINSQIGRMDKSGKCLTIDDVLSLIDRIRRKNLNIKIKINTVVNSVNSSEDLSELIKRARPDRWKIMRMLPVTTTDLSVTSDEFKSFLKRHQAFESIITIEDNNDMEQSYIMVDPYGRFFQNSQNDRGYMYSQPILNVGPRAAFKDIKFCPEKFSARYKTHK